MRYVALICARGGSKGLPGKNVRLLAGKPLIGWSIRTAKQIERISRVIVSTDSVDIARTAREHGAEVPFMRPRERALDIDTLLDFRIAECLIVGNKGNSA